uniref:RNA-directed DNA polymerase n=1 Tax=Heliothis virescens TaxID=7102 RepID=A0A2A4JAD9_HELVI
MDHKRKKPKRSKPNNDSNTINLNSNENQNIGNEGMSGEVSLLAMIAEKIDNIASRLEKVENAVPPNRPTVGNNDNNTAARTTRAPIIGGTSNESILTVENNASSSVGVYFLGSAPERPKFSGGTMNPNKFLKQLQRYIKSIKAEDRALDIAIGSLTGSAQRIMELYSDNWNTFEDFKKDLLEVFWGSRERELAKSRLLDSTWNPNGGSTMEEYFAELVDLVKDLRLPLEESEVVGYIIRHFPQDVQIAWFANRDTSTFKAGIEFLRNIEKNVRRRPVQQETNTHRDVMQAAGRGYTNMNMHARGRGYANMNMQARGRGLGLTGHGIRYPIEPVASSTSGYKEIRDLLFDVLDQVPQEVGGKVSNLDSPEADYNVLTVFEDVDEADTASAGSRLIEIVAQVKDYTLRCLIDTGSQVTCLADASYGSLRNMGVQMPIMPISPVQIQGATRARSCRVDKAVLVPLVINGICVETPCLIVKNLVREIILGIDWLEQWEATVICGPTRSLRLNHLGKMIDINLGEDRMGCRQTDDGHNISVEKRFRCNTSIEASGLNLSGEKAGVEAVTVDTNTLEVCYETEQNISDLISELQASVGFSLNGLRELLVKNKRVFSKHPGRTDKYQHVIKMKDEEPFVKRSYPIPFAYRAKVEEKLKELLALGIIKREGTPYSSPLTCTLKKDGSVRILLDARELNRRMIGDVESPPLVAEILQSFNGVRFITLIDLNNAYFQIPLHPDSTKYTGFTFMGKSYTYTVLPQGLKTSVGSFSRAMDVILGAEVREFCVNYLDDLVVFTKFGDLDTHLGHLDHVLGLLGRANMTCSLKKCQFIKNEVRLLGHIVSPDGIRMDPSKVAAIKEFPTPRTVKQLRAFLGLMNYYRRFVAKYSHMTVPFCRMLQKGRAWKWTPEEDRQFEAVKHAFIETVVLIHPDNNRQYYLQTDSSGVGVAGCLYQLDDEDNEHVVGFCSKALTRPEQQWTVSEQELWAVVYSLKKFETYLKGTKVVIRTDHKSLSFINNWNLYSARVTRWILFMQQFDYTVEHIKGSDNIVPDILSRYAYGVEAVQELRKVCLDIAMFTTRKAVAVSNSLKAIAKAQRQDTFYKSIIDCLVDGSVKEVRCRGGKFILNDDKLIYKRDHTEKEVIVVPESLQVDIIQAVHEEAGHFGEARIKRLVSDRFYFIGMAKAVKSVLRQCDLCQKTKHVTETTIGPCKPVVATEVGEIVMADWYGPLPPGKYGMQYILVIQDSFSKFIHLYALRRATTKAALSCVRKYMSAVPIQKLVTDNGRQFTSRHWSEGLHQLGIIPSHTTVRNPRPNSTERVNKELGRLFRAYCHKSHRSWVGILSNIVQCYNNTIHSSTGYTPNEVLVGVPPTLSVDKALTDGIANSPVPSVEEIRAKARSNLIKAAATRSQVHDKRYKLVTFKLGDLVKVRKDNRSDSAAKVTKKFSLLYDGPYKVGGIPHANAYLLVDADNGDVVGTYNALHLERYYK